MIKNLDAHGVLWYYGSSIFPILLELKIPHAFLDQKIIDEFLLEFPIAWKFSISNLCFRLLFPRTAFF